MKEVKLVYEYHGDVRTNIKNYLDTVDLKNNSRSAMGIIGPFIPRGLMVATIHKTAWSKAIETEAISLFDYDMAYDMTNLYDLQNRGVISTINKIMDYLTHTLLFDTEKSSEEVQVFQYAMNELSKQEEFLEEEYMEFLEKYQK